MHRAARAVRVPGVQTSSVRQSSARRAAADQRSRDGPGRPRARLRRAVAPARVASRTPRPRLGLLGRTEAERPTGGAAYGMPRKTRHPRRSTAAEPSEPDLDLIRAASQGEV